MSESVVLCQAQNLILSESISIVGFKGQSVSGAEYAANDISYSRLTNYGNFLPLPEWKPGHPKPPNWPPISIRRRRRRKIEQETAGQRRWYRQ